MQAWSVVALGLGFVCVVGCAGIERFDTPIEPRDPWVRVPASGDAMLRISAARDYSRERGGRSMLVLEGDEVRFEEFYNGHSASTPWPFWSGTKTFSCLIASVAEDQGILSLDERVSDTVTEWAGVLHKEDITVEHLLRFTSGLKPARLVLSNDGFKAVEDQRVADKYAFALDQPAIHPPGTVWEYDSVHLAAFGGFMEHKLGESPVAWLEREVLEPLDLRVSGWNHDPDGNPMLAYGAWTTAGELSKLGALLRDDGWFQGEQLLPEGTLDRCMVPGEVNPAYGLASWLNEEMGASVTFRAGGLRQHGSGTILGGGPPMLVAAGARGQRVYVIPSLDWVVVHQGDSNRFHDPEFMSLLLGY